jgi:hypothetical protein
VSGQGFWLWVAICVAAWFVSVWLIAAWLDHDDDLAEYRHPPFDNKDGDR